LPRRKERSSQRRALSPTRWRPVGAPLLGSSPSTHVEGFENDREPKYDIREWSPDGQILSKGVTLSKEELVALNELLNKMEA
jgi:hypothetical protein